MQKHLLTIVLLAGALGGTGVEAQQYHQIPVTQSGNAVTNGVNQVSTNVTASDAIGLTKYGDVTLVLQYNLTANTGFSSNVTFNFAGSADGTNFNTTPPSGLVFAVPSNGTNTVTFVTNVTVGSTGYLELFSIGNTATNAATNINVQAWVKPKRNG